MNRLSFRNFHQKHFGPEQKLYWQTFLNPKQQEQQQQQWYYFDEEAEQDDDDEYADPFDEAEYRVDADDPQRQEEFRQHHLESNELNVEDFEEESLNADDSVALQFMSEEALEVFQFSENFRKQKEEEAQRIMEEERRGEENWQYDESNVLNSGISEPPTTCLVLVNQQDNIYSKSESGRQIRLKEDLLNSSYLASCRSRTTTSVDDAPIVLWPVVPFKL